jgi:NADH-quinone oxidoreductase subunit E
MAELLDMAPIRVLEVATFYTMFHLAPVGKHHFQLCGTTPCMLRGAEDLKKVCQHKIHHDPHQLSPDGNFSWEEVECLGACVNAPMVQIWKDTYEDLTTEDLSGIIDDLAAGRPVKPGPQNGRQLSAPEGGPTTLTDPALYSGKRIFTRIEPAPPAAPGPAAPPPPAAAPPPPEAKPAAAAAATQAAEVPPSQSGRPATAAQETAPAVSSPSPAKTEEAKQDSGKFERRAAESAQPTKAPERVAAARRTEATAVKPAEGTSAKIDTTKEPQSAPVEGKAQPAASQSPRPAAQRETPAKKLQSKPASAPVAGPEWVAVPRAVAPKPAPERPDTNAERSSQPAETAAVARKTTAKSSGQPELLKKPRSGKGDDLKLIWGVGPKLEAMLNGMGIWHFDQIAAWSKTELAWIDERLEGFKGRASRDEWIKQAKKLAKGWRPDGAIGDRPKR